MELRVSLSATKISNLELRVSLSATKIRHTAFLPFTDGGISKVRALKGTGKSIYKINCCRLGMLNTTVESGRRVGDSAGKRRGAQER